MLEKTLESPLNCKEIQPVHSEGDQPWDFFGRNDAEAETPESLFYISEIQQGTNFTKSLTSDSLHSIGFMIF